MDKHHENKASNSSRSEVRRLKNIAFWLWEYQRRNIHYKRYCDVIEEYFKYFDSIGELEYILSQDTADELFSYFYDADSKYDVKNNPIKSRLEQTHGLEAGLFYFKLCFLSEKFRSNFYRVYKHYSIGLDVEECLEKILQKEQICFETNDNQDIAAVLKIYKNWKIKIDDDSPTYYIYELEKSGKITIDPDALMNDPSEIGQEAHAINLIYKSMRCFFEEQHVKTETLKAVYDLVLSGENINRTDEMRVAVLWLWDKAHADDYLNPAPFDTVYTSLKAWIKENFAYGSIWEQILYRRSRILHYYEAVGQSISQMTVIPLKSAKKASSAKSPNSTS